MCEAWVDSVSEVHSRMRALNQTHVGMKIYQLNKSELSPNIFSLFFQFLNGSRYGRINNIYQYTETFNLINTTIKNIALNIGRIWRHPVLSQAEVLCTVAILQGDRPFSLCRERSQARQRALTFRKSVLGRTEHTSGEDFKLDSNIDMKENYPWIMGKPSF